MATQRLDFAGYFFGVEDAGGHITEYPNYYLALEGFKFRKSQGQTANFKMRAMYVTPWMDANAPNG